MSLGHLRWTAPLAAATLIAQQVGSNAIRDGLVLTWFPVTALPYFMAGAAVLSIPAALYSGRLMVRLGPDRQAPVLLSGCTVLFLFEWWMLPGYPRFVSVLLFLHSSVLGAVAISGFWSLMNERTDPYSAKGLLSTAATAATFGGLLGGVGVERITASFSISGVIIALAVTCAVAATAVTWIASGKPIRSLDGPPPEATTGAVSSIRSYTLLHRLAWVTALAAVLATLVDYQLKVEAVGWLGNGEPLVRFFGLFYAATGIAGFLLQALFGRRLLRRLGLGSIVAVHPAAVGASGALGLILPFPWLAILARGLDTVLRNSISRTGYELLFTPLPESAKRAAKSFIDVTVESAGKGVGAAFILVSTALAPTLALLPIKLGVLAVATIQFAIAARLQSGYTDELADGLRRRGGITVPPPEATIADFTAIRSFAALKVEDLNSILGLSSREALKPGFPDGDVDPVARAAGLLVSRDSACILREWDQIPSDPKLVSLLAPLLADERMVRPVAERLRSMGPAAAGALAGALLDPFNSPAVRRRIPLVLRGCESALAWIGLVEAIRRDPDPEVRKRSTRSLLALEATRPELADFSRISLADVRRELDASDGCHVDYGHLFNLLALVLDREPMLIAARAAETTDDTLRGAALEYLQTTLPADIFARLEPCLALGVTTHAPVRSGVEVRRELIEAGKTLTFSVDDLRRKLEEKGEEWELNS